ncbi:hypothetical protein LU276_05095 [Moraxella haemolytica]|uniref:hypothetical protein n=1 Tax=Moraxella haemolytica TaxID=2904119 RepID=UPI002542D23A|nr:hypothetical protein [Moraxella sp. ZY171148]WII94426.1 hypothetical protein LU276_05095 [Moraxella sp. ZY171148]
MTQTLTTLNRTEAKTLQDFIYQVDAWQAQHGDKANHIEIIYYPEDDGFEVVNGEKDNGVLKRNRTTAFRAEILAWATNQLNQLKGWGNDKAVTVLHLVYANDEFGVAVEVVPTTSLASETEPTDELADEEV